MRGSRRLFARLATVAAAAVLFLAGCGGGPSEASSVAHTTTPNPSARAAILRAVDIAFFTTTGATPALHLTAIKEVGDGSTDWARVSFAAARNAPPATRQGLGGGHDRGLLRHRGPGGWTWLGYLAPGASCRTAGRAAPDAVARLLGLPPVCASAATPKATPPPAAVTGRATATTLSSGELATLLSIFITAKNAGPAGQVLTPSTIQVSTSAPPRAATVSGGAVWAMVTYKPAPGAPEPLTAVQLENGQGTAFFSRQPGQSWALRGFAGQPFCTGASAAQVPPSVLSLWGRAC